MSRYKKKTDQRTEYTRYVICQAFLQLKRTYAYEDITIAELCRQANIGRATFYRHYPNMAEVLDDVLNLALEDIASLEERFTDMEQESAACKRSLCMFIREHTEYQGLFYDDALTSLIVDKICQAQQTSDLLDYFQISGCLAAVKKSRHLNDEEWRKIQRQIDALLRTRTI